MFLQLLIFSLTVVLLRFSFIAFELLTERSLSLMSRVWSSIFLLLVRTSPRYLYFSVGAIENTLILILVSSSPFPISRIFVLFSPNLIQYLSAISSVIWSMCFWSSMFVMRATSSTHSRQLDICFFDI